VYTHLHIYVDKVKSFQYESAQSEVSHEAKKFTQILLIEAIKFIGPWCSHGKYEFKSSLQHFQNPFPNLFQSIPTIALIKDLINDYFRILKHHKECTTWSNLKHKQHIKKKTSKLNKQVMSHPNTRAPLSINNKSTQ